jgi:hypothetical protein
VWVFDHPSGAVIGIQSISEDGVFICELGLLSFRWRM